MLSRQDTSGLQIRCHKYNTTNTPVSTPAEKHPVMLPPNLQSLLIAAARVPPFLFLCLYQLISAWFSTKSHLGMATCQLRWAITQTRQHLINICLPGSKTFLFTLLTPLLTSSPCLSFPLLPISHCLISATKSSHTLNREQTKCGIPPTFSSLSPPLCHFAALVFACRVPLLYFLFSDF